MLAPPTKKETRTKGKQEDLTKTRRWWINLDETAISGGESTDDKVSLPSKAVEITCYTVPIMWRWFRWVLGEFFFKIEGAEWPFTGNIPRSVTKFLSCQTVSVKDCYLFFGEKMGGHCLYILGKSTAGTWKYPPKEKERHRPKPPIFTPLKTDMSPKKWW